MDNQSKQLNINFSSVVQLVTILLLVIGSFLVGSLWQRVQFLEKGYKVGDTAGAATTNTNQPSKPKVSLATVKDVFNKSAIHIGDVNKKILFIEVGDPSCPYCHIASGKNPELNKQAGNQFILVADGGTYVAPVPEMKKLLDQGKASFAYVYSQGHGNGEMGVKALYCANEKGKFWDVHDLIMSSKGYEMLNQTIKNDKTKSSELADFLKSAIDQSFMKSCLDSGKYDNQPNEDIKLATTLGVSGTPGFLVNDTVFGGAYSFKDMESVVKASL